MRGPMLRDALVRAVRGWAPDATKKGDADRALAASLSATNAWRGFFRKAAVQGVAVPAFDMLRPFVPKEVARNVEEHLAALGLENELSQRALAKCVAALDAEGIRVVVLKGTPLAERYYGAAAARPSNDIDLLVAEGDLDRALEALGTVGYRLVSSDATEVEHFLSAHHHLVLGHDAYPIVELHFAGNVAFGARLAAEPLLERSIPWTSAAGTTMRVLAPEDEFIFLAMHAASHRFSRLVWLLDLSLFSRVHALRATDVVARARDAGLGNLVAAAIVACRETTGLAWPDSERVTLDAMSKLGFSTMKVDSRERADFESLLQFAGSVLLCDSPRRAINHSLKKVLHDLPFRYRRA